MKLKKELFSIFLITIAFILFFTFNTLCFIFSTLLILTAFRILGVMDVIGQALLSRLNINEQISPIATNTIIIFSLIFAQATASANMAPITFKSIGINKSFESEITDIFNKYEISTDSDKDLVQLSCALENRLTYILASISSIEETDKNSTKRYKNLALRRNNYTKNVSKINRRNKNAGEELLIVNIPNIDITEVDVKQAYKRILIYAKQIEHDIDTSGCDNSCKYRNIDSASFQIIKELDVLRAKLDGRNMELSQTERSFDKLEELQRIAEHKLIARGF